jgi:hypothetical protein
MKRTKEQIEKAKAELKVVPQRSIGRIWSEPVDRLTVYLLRMSLLRERLCVRDTVSNYVTHWLRK